jgi:hypothetical protein
VLLHQTNLTFVVWIQAPPILGISLPFVWQRTVTPMKEAEKWTFRTETMRIGRVEIPKILWPKVNSTLGLNDDIFAERQSWLAGVPNIALMNNELSTAPELRLYSYQPLERDGL